MKDISIGMIGYMFMGRAHSNAYSQIRKFFPELDVNPVQKVVVGRNQAKVDTFASEFGWQETGTEWETMVRRDDIDLVDNSAPSNIHKDPVIAALEAGKHVLCEKPLALTVKDAEEMVRAAEKAGTINMLGHNYRRAPAIQLAKKLIDDGRLGTIRHFRGTYLQDWLNDPELPAVWRTDREVCGSGAHGDLNAHILDLAIWLVGDINKVVGTSETFIHERQKIGSPGEMQKVTVDDATAFLARFEGGAMGTFEATRFATGRKNFNRFEINGSKGSVVFNLERMNELDFFSVDDEGPTQGFRNILATESSHRFAGNWWPPGHIIGYEHTFTHQMVDLLTAIRDDTPTYPTFADGLKVQKVLEAVDASVEKDAWQTP